MDKAEFSKRLIISLFLLFCIFSKGFSQEDIKGVVFDKSTGDPLVGASVYLDKKQKGAITDMDGVFRLSNVDFPTKINVSFIGYEDREIVCKVPNYNLSVGLIEKSNFLDDVVVVGYGTQSRQNLASSISTVTNETYKDTPVSSLDQVLQGRSSGVQLTSPSGNLGTAPILRIRGVSSITSGTSPLYVVDGVPIQSGNLSYSGDTNLLSDLNPDDIESMSILKDAAAAALYGSRAANGVVLITTKKGAKRNVKVSYNGWVGVASPVKKYKVLNAEDFVSVKNYAVKNRFGTDEYSLQFSSPTTDGSKAFNLSYDKDGNVADTNWDDYVFQSGFQQSHSVNVGGGNDKIQYYVSANYLDQNGILKGDKYNRLGASFSFDVNATSWLKLGVSQLITNSNQETADRSRGGNIMAYSAFTRLAWANAPNVSAYAEDGAPTQEQGSLGYGNNTVKAPLDNPLSVIQSGSLVKTESLRWLATFYGEIIPFKNFSIRTNYGRDYIRTEDRDFYAPTVVKGYSQNGVATNVMIRNTQYTWTNTANYKLFLDNNNFNFLVGVEIAENKYKHWGSTRSNLIDGSYKIYEAAYKNITAIDGKISENSLLSYFGRINYDYDSRYIVSLNYRRDGYSALSEKHRWGNFGGFSVAWRISEEVFFNNLKSVFSDLKIKASWGVVGNTRINDYASKSYYSSSYYGIDGTYVLGQIGDSNNLKWETSKKTDVGFSTLLWNKIYLDFDYYHSKSSDLILEVPIAPSNGVPNDYIITNAGSMINKGIEVSINSTIIDNKKFSWNTNFNFSTNKNEVTSLSDGVTEFVTAGNGETTNITKVGKSIGQLYLYETQGVDQETGRRVFTGKNGEKVLMYYEKSNKFYTEEGDPYLQSDLKRVTAGNTLPTWFGGWTNNFQYLNFDLSIFLQFSGGNKIYNGSTATLSDVRFWNNSEDYKNNFWTPDNKNAKYALPVYGDNYSNGSALPITDWVENGNYLRLKNLSLGYTFTKKNALKNVGISFLRIYVQAQNLFVITKYSGLDPEVISQTQSPTLAGGTDHNTAPQARTFTFGAQITF